MFHSPGCGWWVRWHHRRLRDIDRQLLWPALRAAASREFPEDEEEAVVRALRLWALHVSSDEQYHWQCPCADEESVLTPSRAS